MKRRDPLLEALARHAREEDRLAGRRWEALAAGELSPAEAEELRALSEAGEAPPEAYDLLRPFDEAERDALAEGVFAALEAKRGPAAPGTPPMAETGERPAAPAPKAAETVERSAAPAPKPAVVIPIGRRVRPIHALATALSLAAAVALFFTLRGGAPGPVPTYAALIEGGTSDQRPYHRPTPGPAPSASARLATGARINVTLRPETSVGGELDVRAFVRRAGTLTAFHAPVEVKPSGSFRVAGIERGMLGGEPEGEVDLIFVVGRPASLPSDELLGQRLRAPGASPGGEGYQILTVHLLLEGPP